MVDYKIAKLFLNIHISKKNLTISELSLCSLKKLDLKLTNNGLF